MKTTKKQEKERETFAANVLALAEKAGATVFDAGMTHEGFKLQTPIGEMRGGCLFDEIVWLRFFDPTGAPPFHSGDFNRYSHKWNIQRCQGYADALETLAVRLSWACGREISVNP